MRKSTKEEQSPAFQFYAGDWISDPSRLKMSLDEQGAYVLLYCVMFAMMYSQADNKRTGRENSQAWIGPNSPIQ